MNHLVVTAWVGAGVLYVFLLWSLIDGWRHHLRHNRAAHTMTPGELIVFGVYFLTIVGSLIQETVIHRAITDP